MTSFVACPACGGPVHPVAGRCKHCKADLIALREQAEQAARAQAAGLRQTFKSAPPPPAQAAPRRAPTANDQSAPITHTPAPQIIYAQPSAWSRRWPIAVSALAIVAIGVSLVMLLESGNDDDGRLPDRSGSGSPHLVPDDMQTPNPGGLGAGPHGSNIPDPTPPPDPAAPAPKAWTTAPDPGMFPVALTETVCAKMADCGFADDFADMLCREIAKGVANPDLDDKVKSGQCRYNRSAASSCLQAIDRMSCDPSRSADLTVFFEQATELFECSTAYVCN